MQCTAGQTTIVIDHDGHFRSCELRPKLAKLQDFNFDLSAALHSAADDRTKSKPSPTRNAGARMPASSTAPPSSAPRCCCFTIPWSYLRIAGSGFPPSPPTNSNPSRHRRSGRQLSDESILPQRIVSLQPSATVTLHALGLLDRVVACTKYCADVVPEVADGQTPDRARFLDRPIRANPRRPTRPRYRHRPLPGTSGHRNPQGRTSLPRPLAALACMTSTPTSPRSPASSATRPRGEEVITNMQHEIEAGSKSVGAPFKPSVALSGADL